MLRVPFKITFFLFFHIFPSLSYSAEVFFDDGMSRLHACVHNFGTIGNDLKHFVDVGQYKFANFNEEGFWDGKVFEGSILSVPGFPHGKQYFIPSVNEIYNPLGPTMSSAWREVLAAPLSENARLMIHKKVAQELYAFFKKGREKGRLEKPDDIHKYELVFPAGTLKDGSHSIYISWEEKNNGVGHFINYVLFEEPIWKNVNPYHEQFPWGPLLRRNKPDEATSVNLR